MVEVYIVSIEDFKNRASISKNILTERFKQESGIIQEQFAPKILCNTLYEKVLGEISNESISVEISALLPYLKDFLVHKIEASYLVDCNYIATPSGFRVKTDDTSLPVEAKGMAKMIQKQEARADYYQDALVNFLKSNVSNYPEWEDSSCACKDIRANKMGSFSKIGKKKKYNKIRWT